MKTNIALLVLLAAGAYVAFAPVGPVASTVTSGAVITGGVVSCTKTVNVAVDVFPAASFAVTVTVVVPNGRIVPALFEKVSEVTPTTSVAVEVNVPTFQPVDCVASTAQSRNRLSCGRINSDTDGFGAATAVPAPKRVVSPAS